MPPSTTPEPPSGNPLSADPLSALVELLRPRAVFTKAISGAGRWAVRYEDFGHPSFAVVTDGACRLAVQGQPALTLHAGDFVLLPRTPGFTLSGFAPAAPRLLRPEDSMAAEGGELRHGRPDGPPEVRILGGYVLLDAAEAGALDPLLRGLLPGQVHVRGVERFSALVRHLVEEAAEARPGRDLVLARLVDILLVEALRLAPPASAPAGLLRGLADARLARALGQIHAAPARPWTLATLAREAALSRSAFFERFTRQVGLSPLAYLLAWRMALARRLLRQGNRNLGAVAAAVGYASASTFSTAFRRHTGQPPGRYARAWAEAAQAGASQSARATDIGMAEENWRAREDETGNSYVIVNAI